MSFLGEILQRIFKQMKNYWLLTSLFAVYIGLLLIFGYFAAFTSHLDSQTIIDAKNQFPGDTTAEHDSRQLIYDEYSQNLEASRERNKLIFQSFNVILGAVLGFLSSTTLFFFGRKDEVKAIPPSEVIPPKGA